MFPALRRLPLLVVLLAAGCSANAEWSGQERTFGRLVADLSEDGGYFDTDNLISNESSYLHVLDDLAARGVSGGVYLGVGPGQNFSYIAAVRPELAFIVDIRRDNMLQHLLYKGLFAVAANRGEFLALLLGLPREAARSPAGEPADRLVARLAALQSSAEAAVSARRTADSVIATFGVPLDDDARATIARFHETFIGAGLSLRFRTHGRAPQPYYPTLSQLITERDRSGRMAGYLASDTAFAVVRALQLADRIIPVTGDFAGEHALRAIGDEIRRRGLRVSAFYTSNVEFYLVRQGQFGAFIRNLEGLPVHDEAVIIRSVFRGPFGQRDPRILPGYGSAQLVHALHATVEGWNRGTFRSYWDVVADRP